MKSFSSFTEDQDNTDLVIIYPGRFQPAHKNHANVYKNIQKKFPNSQVYISTSNDVKEKSPFTFEERKLMLVAAGVNPNNIIMCRNPYVADEIKNKHNISNTKIIFAVGAKDMDPSKPRFSVGLKKDGEPKYMQISSPITLDKITINDLAIMHTADKHAYVSVAPTLTFSINIGTKNVIIQGATDIRNLYTQSSIHTRKSIISQLYDEPRPDIYEIFNKKLL